MILIDANLREGFVILLAGIVIVFLALVLLFVIFQYAVPFILKAGSRQKMKMQERRKSEEAKRADKKETTYVSGEEMAAVATAVYMYLEETHDEEPSILTIGKTAKSYSPWSSKIYATYNWGKR